jgi:hypothetical protein
MPTEKGFKKRFMASTPLTVENAHVAEPRKKIPMGSPGATASPHPYWVGAIATSNSRRSTMYTNPVTDRYDGELGDRGSQELTYDEAALVGGGFKEPPPLWRVIEGHGPMDLLEEYNQRVLDHGDGLAD